MIFQMWIPNKSFKLLYSGYGATMLLYVFIVAGMEMIHWNFISAVITRDQLSPSSRRLVDIFLEGTYLHLGKALITLSM